jgi:hypothetical protein
MAIGARSLVNDRHQPDNQRMPQRFQFSLKWLFVAMLAAACFFGGIRFERERRRLADEAAALANKKTEIFSPRISASRTGPSPTPSRAPVGAQPPTEPTGLSDEVIFLPRRSRVGD